MVPCPDVAPHCCQPKVFFGLVVHNLFGADRRKREAYEAAQTL